MYKIRKDEFLDVLLMKLFIKMGVCSNNNNNIGWNLISHGMDIAQHSERICLSVKTRWREGKAQYVKE